MALASFTAKETTEIEILNPETNTPFEPSIFISVHGSDSETFRKIQRKNVNKRLEMQSKSFRKKQTLTAEELEAEGLDTLIACTDSWKTGDRNEIEFNEGEWLQCTPENVRKIYTALPWLKEQIDSAIGDRSNFLQSAG